MIKPRWYFLACALSFLWVSSLYADESAPAIEWQRKLSLGYSQTGGNSDTSEFRGEVFLNRKTKDNEWTGKWNNFISTSKEEENARKFYGMLRYAYSFGCDLKWYNFYKFEGDQDIFANVDYRLVPSSGMGYWFSDQEPFKAMVETAIGFEHTNYVDKTESKDQAVLIPRGFLEKTLTGQLKLQEDLTLYSGLESIGEYRLHSETSLTHPINSRLSWKVSFIDDYNSEPSGAAEKNDYRLITAIDYNF